MAIAFVFPGQGSQVVGMGKPLAEQFAQARAVFEEVDDALNEKLSKIIFEGPMDVLTRTENTQPALMAVSLAVMRVLESEGLALKDKVSFLAGHSLGEYSAHCSAGSFSLSDTAQLLRIRGHAMQESVPIGKGAMLAIIGLEENIVEAICNKALGKGICQIANDNGGGQIVVSGEKEAVEYVAELAKEEGAKKSVILPVSSPFHSVLMEPARQAMEEAFKNVEKHTPSVPIVPNVSVLPEKDIEVLTKLLVEQVTGRVRWRETINWFANNGITEIYEIGAGKVLTGLTRRINKDIKAINVGTIEEIENALKSIIV